MPAPHAESQKPARSRGAAASAATDALRLLKADHDAVTDLFMAYERLAARAEADKRRTAEEICRALTLHAQIEEEIFYPEVRAALGGEDQAMDLLNEAEVEHGSVKDLVSDIEQDLKVIDEKFDAKVKVLGEYVRHHVKEEQNELFPLVRRSSIDLKDLAVRLARRKEELSS